MVEKPTRPDKTHRLHTELVYTVRKQVNMAVRYAKNHVLDGEDGDTTDYRQE